MSGKGLRANKSVYILLPLREGHEEDANGAMSYFKYTVTLKGMKVTKFEIQPLTRQPVELTIQ